MHNRHRHLFAPRRGEIGTVIVALELAANIAVFAPEVIVIRSALTPDVDEIRSEIAKLIPENLIPDLVHVDSFDDFCLHGALLMGIGVGID